jgi:hypothetical protein
LYSGGWRGESPAVTVIPVRWSEPIVPLFLAQAGANAYHGWSHAHSSVPTTPAQQVFIVIVIVALPIVATGLVLFGKRRVGYALFSAAMLAGFLFGAVSHFVLDTPDFYANVHGPRAIHFSISAVLLAIAQFLGFIVPVLWWRNWGSSPSWQ